MGAMVGLLLTVVRAVVVSLGDVARAGGVAVGLLLIPFMVLSRAVCRCRNRRGRTRGRVRVDGSADDRVRALDGPGLLDDAVAPQQRVGAAGGRGRGFHPSTECQGGDHDAHGGLPGTGRDASWPGRPSPSCAVSRAVRRLRSSRAGSLLRSDRALELPIQPTLELVVVSHGLFVNGNAQGDRSTGSKMA